MILLNYFGKKLFQNRTYTIVTFGRLSSAENAIKFLNGSINQQQPENWEHWSVSVPCSAKQLVLSLRCVVDQSVSPTQPSHSEDQETSCGVRTPLALCLISPSSRPVERRRRSASLNTFASSLELKLQGKNSSGGGKIYPISLFSAKKQNFDRIFSCKKLESPPNDHLTCYLKLTERFGRKKLGENLF